ncbi:MAG: hypothetical protein HY070_04885 [Chloroflexi bacterium]|nr:hypothetical protein [Chloroflexota bacterium]
MLARRAEDDVEKQLRVAADQFVIHRAHEKENRARILAGYPWFDERTRETLIALEGLLIVTRRYAEAKEILRACAREIENGLLPNRIRADGARDFDAADVTLWFFHALDRYHAATRDDALVRELFPQLESVIEWHVNGTRNNIHVDPRDGLLFAGEAGTALTWMDARVGDAAITPRIGKPVEINALWYRALRVMERWAKRLKRAPEKYAQMADRAQIAFERFWFAEGGYLYDVIDAPNGDAAALRPNQLFALSLANDLVTRARGESILQIVTTELLTPLGLRTLAPRDPNYRARYHGSADERDAASHQGAVWAWLIGAYVDAYQNVYGEKPARDLFAPFHAAMQAYALGTLGEIFEPAPPFASVGGMAYAASVAEVLRIRARD